MKKTIIFLLLTLFKLSFGELAINPMQVKVKLKDSPSTKMITLINNGNAPIRVETRTENVPKENQKDFKDLTPYISRVSPSRFIIPPNSSRDVRFTISPTKDMKEGIYGAALYLSENFKNPAKFNQQLENGIKAEVSIVRELGVAIIVKKEA